MITTRARVAILLSCIVLAIVANSALGLSGIDGDTGKPASVVYEDGSSDDGSCIPGADCDDSQDAILVHVSGSEIGYEAYEDTAYCMAPSVEISYTSNLDGSGTVECSIPKKG